MEVPFSQRTGLCCFPDTFGRMDYVLLDRSEDLPGESSIILPFGSMLTDSVPTRLLGFGSSDGVYRKSRFSRYEGSKVASWWKALKPGRRKSRGIEAKLCRRYNHGVIDFLMLARSV
jgi:hypothetical protein